MPPPQSARKRPWYLVAALLGALAYGMNGGCHGFGVWSDYHGDPNDRVMAVADYAVEADREAVTATRNRLIDAYDTAAPREYPMGIAMLLVGFAMAFFAMRGMSGRASARNVIVQLVVVQAAVCLGEFLLTKDLRVATADWEAARAIAEGTTQNPDAQRIVPFLPRIYGALDAIFLGARTVGSALIAIALTRPRSREFFEAASDPAIEQ